MSVVLPTLPRATQTKFQLQSSAADLKPFLGGPIQRVSRLGDRWVVTFECRAMRNDQAQVVLSSLLEGLHDTVIVAIPQPTYSTTDTTALSGAGRTLVVAGGGTKQIGQFLSIVKSGRRYLHKITAVASNTLTILPALKVSISGGETVELAAPKIEGFLEGNSQSWTLGLVENVGLSFVVLEAN